MLKYTGMHNNEKGFVLVTSLLVLLILMVIGIAATSTTSIELQIAGNEKAYKQNFYSSEASVMEAAQMLENEDDSEQLRAPTTTYVWLNNWGVYDLENYSSWTINSNSVESSIGLGPDVSFASLDKGISGGSSAGSLLMTSTALHEYTVYGVSKRHNGQVLIEVGYKKRF